MTAPITLTDEQEKHIALTWITKQQHEGPKAYEPVLKALLEGAYVAHWAWTDALKFAVKLCSKNYGVRIKHVLELLE